MKMVKVALDAPKYQEDRLEIQMILSIALTFRILVGKHPSSSTLFDSGLEFL